MEGQVADADTLLLNKCDLVETQTLDRIESELHALNTKANIARVVAIRGMEEGLWDAVVC